MMIPPYGTLPNVTMSHDQICSLTIGTNWSDIKVSDSPQLLFQMR